MILRFIIGLIFLACPIFAQEKQETIPLNKSIGVEILSIDSTTLKRYISYDFKHENTKATFWAARDDKRFKTGTANIELCKIKEVKDSNILVKEDGLNIRCGISRGYELFVDGVLVKKFDFDEYSKSPTLRLCSTDK